MSDVQSPARCAATLPGGGYNPYEAEFIRGYEDAENGRAQASPDEAFARIAHDAGFAAAGWARRLRRSRSRSRSRSCATLPSYIEAKCMRTRWSGKVSAKPVEYRSDANGLPGETG